MNIDIPLAWNDSFLTGITKIDEQHKVLVNTLNEAHARLGDQPTREILDDITRNLLSYALYHFETEETLMQEHAYQEACPEESAKHHKEHRDFSQTVVNLRNGIKEGQLVSREELIGFLSHWLVTHILFTDQKLGAYLTGRNLG
ncbi:MAG: hemerythrin family protein [Hydrogenophilales bacterium]|nr:hemerythrin family protein [Hydrogenophilales bacterium]